MFHLLPILLVSSFFQSTLQALQSQEFQIQVRYSNDEGVQKNIFTLSGIGINEWEEIGLLKIPKSSYESPFVQFTKSTNRLIDKTKLTNLELRSFATLKLVSQKSGLEWFCHIEYYDQKNIYISSNQLGEINEGFQELIQIIPSGNSNSITAFEYQVRQPLSYRQLEEGVIVKYFVGQEAPSEATSIIEEKPQNEEQQQQPGGIFGMIMQYKWYIIIGVIVLFLTSGLDTDKLNEQMNQASSSVENSQRRGGRRQQ